MERLDELIEIIETAGDTAPDLSGFTADELEAAHAAIRKAGADHVASLREGTADDLTAARQAVDAFAAALDAVEAEQEARKTAAAELDEVAGRFDTSDDDQPADEEAASDESADDEPVVEAEPVQASSRPSIREMVARRPATAQADTADVAPTHRTLHAAVGGGDEVGSAFGTPRDLGTALTHRYRNLSPREDLAEVRSPVARTRWSENFSVDEHDTNESLQARIFDLQAAARDKARRDVDLQMSGKPHAGNVLQAATGICGPAEPIYNQYTVIGTDGMFNVPALGARRGAISVPDSLSYINFDGEEGVAFPYTSAEGAAGSKQKVCLDISCDTPTEFDVIAYSTCLTYSNFMGQFYPERVAAAGLTALAAHAHRVNKALIEEAETQAVSDSTAYGSTDTGGGAVVQFGSSVAFHAAAYRDKYRMPLNSVIDVHVPHWVRQALFADALARNSTATLSGINAQLSVLLAGENVRVNYVHDWQSLSELGLGFFPTTVDMMLFPAGTVVRLTGETLDLGVVRDSVLNTGNEFQTFVETFDGIAKIGHEIMLVQDVQVVPNGETGQQVAITNPTGS